jgi:hypothetical protein
MDKKNSSCKNEITWIKKKFVLEITRIKFVNVKMKLH